MQSLDKFLSLSSREKLLLFEAAILLVVSSLSVRMIPFRHICRFLQRHPLGPGQRGVDEDELARIQLSLSRAAKLGAKHNLCLCQSISKFIMLRRRGIPVVMVAGARLADSSMQAHAWVCSDMELGEHQEFTVLLKIGEAGS